MIHLIKHLPFFICFFVLASFSVTHSNGSIELLLANLHSYTTKYSPSKVYLQTDRSMYALEDTVWFKVYTLDAANHIPTTIGKVIYVDILDSNGNLVEGKKLYAEHLGTASDVIIGREWMPGRYTIRAYTRFMLNQDQAYIYNKEIQIIDINKAYEEISTNLDNTNKEIGNSASSGLEIKFFPESGDLVDGINSRVAIKVENYSSALDNLTGTIEDSSGNIIAPFKIFERGYGLVSFTPEVEEKYIAKLDNTPTLYHLPEVKAKGHNITAINRSDYMSFMISTNLTSGLSEGDIVVHSRGKVVYHEKLDDENSKSHGLKLDTKEMPTGVMQIAFFDKDGIPRAERLFYVDNDVVETVIKTNKAAYDKREKVDLSLSIIDDDLKSYDCSVSIVDKSNLAGNSPTVNIKTWMLLNSDLRGEITDPAFFFEKSIESNRSNLLDLVMMTHGWRRFAWDDMSREDILQNLKYERELGLYVKGYTGRLVRKGKAVKSRVMLNFLNNDLIQKEVVTGDDGRFEFGPFIIEDSIPAIIQARKYKEESEKDFVDENRNISINIDSSLSLNTLYSISKTDSNIDLGTVEKFVLSNKYAQDLKDQYNSMQVMLSEVVIEAKRKTKEDEMNKMVSQTSIYSYPSNRLILNDDDRVRNRSVLDLLRTVPGVTVSGSFTNPTVAIRGRTSILFLIDSAPVDLEFINSININDVLVVDILKGANAAIFGSRAGDGVIAIYTGSDPDSKITERVPGIVDIVIDGFDKNRQFYSPDHAKDVSSVYQPDVRTTLYWDPYILVSKGEETSISFFTGDNTADYLVITEGLSETGEPIFGTHEFTVRGNE